MTDYLSVDLREWAMARTAPGSLTLDGLGTHDGLGATLDWIDAVVPGTVAEQLHHDVNSVGHYDAHDWWYRTSFARPVAGRVRLRFEGLATLAQVWLNDTPILSSRNMFVAASVDVTALLADQTSSSFCSNRWTRRSAHAVPVRVGRRPWWRIRICAGFAPPCLAAFPAGRRRSRPSDRGGRSRSNVATVSR